MEWWSPADAFTEGYAHQPQAQPVPQRAATGPDAEDLAIAAAVASATAVLRSGNIQVTHATVERIIAGFADKIWDEAPLSPGAAAVPSRMPPPAEAPWRCSSRSSSSRRQQASNGNSRRRRRRCSSSSSSSTTNMDMPSRNHQARRPRVDGRASRR